MDFKDLLFQHYCENSSDIPMVADVISNAAIEIAHAIEPVKIAMNALEAIAGAGLDPNLFHVVDGYQNSDIMFFKGADEDWQYMIAGMSGDNSVSYPYVPGKVYKLEGGAAIDLMRRKLTMDHWQVYNDGHWYDNGPTVGDLESLGRINPPAEQER